MLSSEFARSALINGTAIQKCTCSPERRACAMIAQNGDSAEALRSYLPLTEKKCEVKRNSAKERAWTCIRFVLVELFAFTASRG
jgi:hypothetical protein